MSLAFLLDSPRSGEAYNRVALTPAPSAFRTGGLSIASGVEFFLVGSNASASLGILTGAESAFNLVYCKLTYRRLVPAGFAAKATAWAHERHPLPFDSRTGNKIEFGLTLSLGHKAMRLTAAHPVRRGTRAHCQIMPFMRSRQ